MKTTKQEISTKPWLMPIASFFDVLGGYEHRTSDVFHDYINFVFHKHFVGNLQLNLKAERYINAYEAMYSLTLAMYNSMVHGISTIDIVQQQMLCVEDETVVNDYIHKIKKMDIQKAMKKYFNINTILKDRKDYTADETIAYMRIADYWQPQKGWIDPFGDLFMTYNSSASLGQFFTPEALCDLMAQMNNVSGVTNDPTSGSARTILAGHYVAKQLGNEFYGVANDIDGTCAKMSAINMLFHHIEGEITCGNGLDETAMHWATKTQLFLGPKGAKAYFDAIDIDIIDRYVTEQMEIEGIESNEEGSCISMMQLIPLIFRANERFHREMGYFSKMLIVQIPNESSSFYTTGQYWKKEFDKAKEEQRAINEDKVKELQSTLILSPEQKKLLEDEVRKTMKPKSPPKQLKKTKTQTNESPQLALF